MIITAIKDRLGNQMFQYACALGLAAKHNTNVKIDKRYYNRRDTPKGYCYDLDVFNIPQNFATDKEIKEYTGLSNKLFHKGLRKVFKNHQLKNQNHIYDERFFNYDSDLEKQGGNLYIRGYWQSYKYFNNVSSEVKKAFSSKTPVNITTDIFARQIVDSNAVCLSIRRGDHLWHPVTKEKFGSCDIDYYLKGIEIIREKNKNLKLFIFSDDIKWCAQNLKFDYPTVFVSNPNPQLKFDYYLQLITLCKHFIIPVSTFPWWGAWLSENKDKIVVAPQIWFTDTNIDTNDLFPEGWIRI